MVELSAAERASGELSSVIGVLRRRRWLPVTVGYVLLLIAVTVAISEADSSIQEQVIEHTSTNLHNLQHGHVSTLLSSAFVLGDSATALTVIPLFAALLALAEVRLGALATVRIFLAGHIGATLLVAVGLWAGMVAGWLPDSLRDAEDVGISYGAMAVFGAFVALVPERWRTAWTTVWLVVALEGVLRGRDFTNVGHLLAYCLGAGLGLALVRRGAIRLQRLTWPDMALLSCAAVLAITFLSD